MKSFIYTLTSLSFLEFVIQVICFYFFIKKYSFRNYMDEIYKNNRNSLDDEGAYIDDFKTSKFSDLFGEYQNNAFGIFHLWAFGLLLIFFNFIPMISFVIVYLCHLCRRTCCMCKKGCSFVSLFFSIFLAFPYIFYAVYAKSKIDLPDEEIFCFDSDLNEKTRKNINFMKIRRIILITGVSLVYVSYIVRFFLLYIFNEKLIIVDENANQVAVYVYTNNNAFNNGNICNNNQNNINNIDNFNTLNQVQVYPTTNDDRKIENK